MPLTKISVIIPTRNRVSLLTLCLESLFTQSELPDEILVIDNGSTDSTAGVVRAFGRFSPVPLRYYYEPRKGPSYARNLGIAKARYALLGFLDDDAVPVRSWVLTAKRLVSLGVDVCQGRIKPFLPSPSITEDAHLFLREITLLARPNFFLPIRIGGKNFVRYSDLTACNFFCLKRVIRAMGHGFDEQLFPFMGEEKEFYVRLKRFGFPVIFEKRMSVRHIASSRWFPFLKRVFRCFSFGFAAGRLRQKYLQTEWGEAMFRNELRSVRAKMVFRFFRVARDRLRRRLTQYSFPSAIVFLLLFILYKVMQYAGYWCGQVDFFLFHRGASFRVDPYKNVSGRR